MKIVYLQNHFHKHYCTMYIIIKPVYVLHILSFLLLFPWDSFYRLFLIFLSEAKFSWNQITTFPPSKEQGSLTLGLLHRFTFSLMFSIFLQRDHFSKCFHTFLRMGRHYHMCTYKHLQGCKLRYLRFL